jgi:alanyl-tRNA synthetase
MRELGDLLRDKLGNSAVVLMSGSGDKVMIVAMASKEAVERGIHSGKVAKEAAGVLGGSGGGRPDMAQAGGKDPQAINEALATAIRVIQSQIIR